MTKDKIYRIIEHLVTFVLGVASTLLLDSCVLTRNSVRHSDSVSISSGASQKQSADSSSINLQIPKQ